MKRLYTSGVRSTALLCSLFAILFAAANPLRSTAQCQSWTPVGQVGFTPQYTFYNGKIAVAPDGTPYVLYRDGGNDYKATVKKFNGSNWVNVGAGAFSTGTVDYSTSLDIDNAGNLYAYFSEAGLNRLMKFDGSTWSYVGDPLPGGTFKLSPDGTPYLAYENDSINLIKYNGSTWQTVGFGFGTGGYSYPSLAFDGSGTPYVSATDAYANLSVYKFNGTDWNTVGTGTVSSNASTYETAAIAVSSTGTPYVEYLSYPDDLFHVQKFNGSTWLNVDSIPAPGYSATIMMAADNADNVYMSYETSQIIPDVFILSDLVYVAKYNSGGVSITSGGTISGDAISGSPSIAIYNNIPYAVYTNYQAQGVVRKLLELSTANSSASAAICSGSTTTISNATAGGYWSSGTSNVASVGSATGVVTGVAGGVTSISYNYGGCNAITTVTVNPWAGYITGFKALNAGTTSTLSSTGTGGAWTSGNTSVATINSSGIVSGVASGTATISYTSSSCGSAVATAIVTVHAATSPACVAWKKVGGPANSSPNQLPNAFPTAMAMSTAPDGTPYLVFADPDHGNQLTVKKYNGTDWVVVGPPGFTTGTPGSMSICFNDLGTPYLAFMNDSVHVLKFDGSAWTAVGDPNAQYGGGSLLSMVITGSDIFIQYIPNLWGGARTLRYSGTDWVDMGTLPGAVANCTNIVADNSGGLYSAGNTVDGFLEICKYTGGHWQSIASHAFPNSGIPSSVTIDKNGAVYVVSSFWGGGITPYLQVMKYDGATWSTVGDTINALAWPESLISASDGSLYLQYVDEMTSVAPVKKLSGGSWTTVANTLSSFGNIGALAVSADGTPYFATEQFAYDATFAWKFNIMVVTPGLFDNVISGPVTACPETFVPYTNTSWGGTWAPIGEDTTASVLDGNGDTYFSVPGPANISYTVGGCTASLAVTVNGSVPPTINGTLQLCAGASDTLTSPISGGSWYSDNTSVASIDITTGKVTTASAGTANISYVVSGTGCGTGTATAVMTVNAAPSAGSITGTLSTCAGNNTTLSNATTGGTWSSSNSAVATVPSAPGIVTGVTAGTSTITYTINNACGSANTTAVVTVNAATSAGTITGTKTVCTGANTTLANATTGGSWSSSNTAVASVNASTGVVSGATAGNTTITYTVSGACGAAYTTAVITVNAAPNAGTITGTKTVCPGANTTLSNATTGGTWTSSYTIVATVNASTGVISGVAAGATTITYTVNDACGAAYTTAVVTVNAATSAGTITGAATVTQGSSITLADAVTGGVWSTSNGNATVSNGIVTGVTVGTVVISYSVTGSCGGAVAAKTVTIAPNAPSGTLTVCSGSSIVLTNGTPGGVWTSGNYSIASVGSGTGIVTGAAPGVVNISYTVGGVVTTASVTVNALPALISGTTTVCAGATTTLTDPSTGGTWSSINTGVATAGIGGAVAGVSAGTATISYTLANGCARTTTVTVIAQPAVTGTATVCTGSTTTLLPNITGGVWGVGSAAATVSNGVVTGTTAGAANISYTIGGMCRSITAVTVNAQPANIGGTAKACPASTTTLTDATTGGTWSSATSSIATADATSGAITGVTAGTAIVSYTGTNGCSRIIVVTVNPSPAAIGGTAVACAGTTTTLTDASTTLSWTSGNTGVATITSGGVVTGVTAGTANVTFTASGTGCTAITIVTINGTAAAIAGASSVCLGTTTTLSNTVSGGTWSSSNTGVATIDAGGIVTGVANGTTTITYNVGNGCYKTKVMTTSTSTNSIQGYPTICAGTTATLTSWGTGTWSSSNSAVASIAAPASGYVTGMAAGNATITFFPATDCYITYPVTVVPAPGAITGTTSICSGDVSSLSNSSTGGTWSSSNTGTAIIGSATGVVTGVGSAGTVIITYAYGPSCRATTTLTVKPIPAVITGTYSVCATATTTLVDVTAGGVWSSSNTAVATVGTGLTWGHGAVSGITAGTTTISFTVPTTGCARSVVVTVDPCSRPIGNETSAALAFQLYPNPSNGALTVVTEGMGTLHVFSLDGKEVAQYLISNGINNLALSKELASGIYMCRYNTSDGNTIAVRLVLEH